MSDGFNWDSEIPTEEELEKRAVKAPTPESKRIQKMEKAPEPTYVQEQVIEESLDEYEFLTNARLRLEQGRLYEMFLKHNLFGDIDSDPRAVANVQKELKEFIQERLEVLLGLKPDPKLRKLQMDQSIPFNSMEIDILKKVIGRISGGATEQAEVSRPIQKSDTLKPLSTSKPSQSINPIGEQQKQPVSIRKTTPTPSEAPSQQEQPKAERPNKPISELTPSERAEWNRQISLEQKAKKAPPAKNHAPMPSYDQQVLHYGSQTNRYAQNALVGRILQSLPNKGEE